MSHGQRFGFGKVCNGERDFEDAMVGPGGEPEASDGLVEQVGGSGVQAAVFFYILGAHLGIAVNLGGTCKPLSLPHSCLVDANADGSRRLTGRLTDQFLDRDRRHLDMHVDAVQERPGETAAVALHLQRTAGAGTDAITQIPAGPLVRYLLQKNSGI